MLDRSQPPISNILTEGHEILQAQSSTLDNGIPLHLILSGSQPLLRIEVIFDAGSWYEEKNNSSFFTTKLLSAGTANISSEEIEKRIALYGAFIDLESGVDRSTITLYTLSKYVEDLMPLLYDIITSSVFPKEELANLQNITHQNLKINLSKTNYLASSRFKEAIFGNDHPYGRSLNKPDIDHLDVSDLHQFYNNFFTFRNCHIIVSGNGDFDFHGVFNGTFGKNYWAKGEKKQALNHHIKTTPGSYFVSKEESIQCSLRMGKQLFTISHSDYFKMYVVTEVLGGYFGSRLMKNIREEKGYTYGIHANLISHKNAGYFVIGTDVNKENTIATLFEIKKEIDILRSEKMKNEELEIVKNYMIGSFFNSINTPFSLADKFKTIYFNGLDYTFYNNYITTIQNITPNDILLLADKYFTQEGMVEVIAGAR